MAIGVTGLTTHTQNGGGTWKSYGSGGGSSSTTATFLSGTSAQGRKFTGAKGFAFEVAAGGTDLSSSIIVVRILVNGGLGATLAGGGASIRLEDTGGNISDWYIAGSDTYNGGWLEAVIDTSNGESANSGTAATLSAIQYVGLLVNAASSSGGDPNVYVDEILSMPNTGLTLTGNTTNVFDELATWDATSLYGIVQRRGGVVFIKCPVILSPDATGHSSTDEVVVFEEPIYEDGTNVDSALTLQGLSSADADPIVFTRLSVICEDNGDIGGSNADKEFDFTSAADVTADTCTIRGFDGTTVHLGATGNSYDGTTFDTCSTITSTGATLNDGTIRNSTAAVDGSAFIWNVNADPDGDLDNLSITKGAAAHHGIEFSTTTPLTMTVRGITSTSFNAADAQNDSFFYVRRTTSTVTINVIASTGNFSYKDSGATVVVVIDPVAMTVVALDNDTKAGIQNAFVTVWCTGTGPFPSDDVVSITRSGAVATVTHTGHGLASGDSVRIDGVAEYQYNGLYEITVTGTNDYTYAIVGTPESASHQRPHRRERRDRGHANILLRPGHHGQRQQGHVVARLYLGLGIGHGR